MLATLAPVPLPELLVHLLKPSREALGVEAFPKWVWSNVLLGQRHQEGDDIRLGNTGIWGKQQFK